MKPTNTILLGAPPGRRRDSLHLLLETMPNVTQVYIVEDLSGLLTAVQTHRPDIIVVETGFDADRIWLLTSLLAAAESRARLIFIVATTAEKERALHSGAHAVLMHGFSTTELRTAITSSFHKPA